MRVCSNCKTPKELGDFDLVNRESGKRSSWCKPCAREKVRAYQKTPAAKAWRLEHDLRVNYNLSVEQYNKLFAKQKGRCAICKTTRAGRGRRFHVDHDHKTNVVRGLLCNSCNRALGLFQDSLVILQKATHYMEKNQ